MHLQYRRWRRHRFDSWVGKIPWRRAWLPTPIFLPGESHEQRSMAGYSPEGCRVGHNWSDWTHTTRLSFGPGKWLNYCEPQFDFILNRLHKTYFSESVLSNGDDYMHAHFQNCIFSNWSTCFTMLHWFLLYTIPLYIYACSFFIEFTFFSLKLSDYNHLSLISIFVFPLLRSLLAQEPSGPRREE